MLDSLKSGSFELIVKNKVTKNVHQVYIHDTKAGKPLLASCRNVVYIQCVGFGVARSDNQGDARASKSGTSDKRTPHAFCIYMNQIIKFAE